MKTIGYAELRSFTAAIVKAAGSAPEEIEMVTDHLLEANLAGHDSHGVGMIPTYSANIDAGTLIANQTPEILQQSDSFAVWDGRSGYGQKIAREAMGWAISAAQKTGVAVHGLRNTHHIGRIGTYGELAAKAGLVSLHFVNVNSGPPPVAPFGGREGRFITNPVCIAIPGTATTAPIILDFATSRIAMGKVRVANNAGKPVVEGALLDHDGNPTTDAAVMYSDPRGVVLPFGEHKGSGLALICELLAGAVVGAGTLRTETPPVMGIKNAMLTIVIDPTRMATRAFLEAEVDGVIAWVKSADPLDPERPVLVAGEPERMMRAERMANGIPIDDTTWAQICDVAQQRQVAVPK